MYAALLRTTSMPSGAEVVNVEFKWRLPCPMGLGPETFQGEIEEGIIRLFRTAAVLNYIRKCCGMTLCNHAACLRACVAGHRIVVLKTGMAFHRLRMEESFDIFISHTCSAKLQPKRVDPEAKNIFGTKLRFLSTCIHTGEKNGGFAVARPAESRKQHLLVLEHSIWRSGCRGVVAPRPEYHLSDCDGHCGRTGQRISASRSETDVADDSEHRFGRARCRCHVLSDDHCRWRFGAVLV